MQTMKNSSELRLNSLDIDTGLYVPVYAHRINVEACILPSGYFLHP